MKLKDLIGYKLEKINNEHIIVSKDDKLYILQIVRDEGDCCGYNDLETKLLIDEHNKPVITDIDYTKTKDADGWGECDSVKITFFGGNKQIAEISSLSSSGSGWSYGACVTIKCKELNIDETITQW